MSGAAEAARHQHIGAAALFAIAHLLGPEEGEARRGHARPLQHAVALHEGRRPHHQHDDRSACRRRSRTAAARRARRAAAARRGRGRGSAAPPRATSGWRIASSRASSARLPKTRAPRRLAVDAAGRARRRERRARPPRPRRRRAQGSHGPRRRRRTRERRCAAASPRRCSCPCRSSR